MPKLTLTMVTPMDMAMFDPTDMDTTSEKGLLMKLLLPLGPTLMQRLTPIMGTGVDTTSARGLRMRLLLPPDLTLMLRLTPIMATGADTTDPTMAMAGDTGERRKGQPMLSLRLRPILTLTLMPM